MKNAQEHVKISVRMTWNGAVRARVRDGDQPAYEVTIGGSSWSEGKGEPYQEEIMDKALELLRQASWSVERQFMLKSIRQRQS